MKKIVIILAITILGYSFKLIAQNEVDALRYSQSNIGGTARNISMGGAFGALGGDFSALSTNPAGIGIYKKSELTFTPSLCMSKVASTYNFNRREDFKYNVNISNFGLVLSLTNPYKDDKWKSFNFGFGLNRNNNFNYRTVIEGVNSQSSMQDAFTTIANSIKDPANFTSDPGTYLAYQTNLVYDTSVSGKKSYSHDAISSVGLLQKKTKASSGNMNEFEFSFGANYDDKLFLGATIGYASITFEEENTYSEKYNKDTNLIFQNLAFNENLKTKGEGFNLKLGMLYKPIDLVRIGLAIHTPTFYNMSDTYYAKMESKFNDKFDSLNSMKEINQEFNYDFISPLKAIGSLALVHGFQISGINYGLILSADYEFVDYSASRFGSDNADFSDINTNIQNKYQPNYNLRFGGEFKIQTISLRGGYAIYNSPYKNNINDGKKTSLSAGIGIKDKDYFIDFAYIQTIYDEKSYLYSPDLVSSINPVQNKYSLNNFVATFGIRF